MSQQRRVMKEFQLDEISLVDVPAQAPARVAIMKRADVEKRIVMTSQTNGHAHTISTRFEGAELHRGTTSHTDGHAHDWVMDDAGNIIIGDADGHTHGVAVIVQKEQDPASGEGTSPEGDTMTKTDAEKAAEAAVEKAQAELAAMQKRAERAEAVAALSADERAQFDVLKGDEQDAFLAKPAEERAEIVKRAAAADAVVYTALDGTVFRKNDDQRLVALAKRADEATKQLETERALAKRAAIEKRASEELGHLKGDLVVKADLLAALETLPEDRRAPALEILKAQDAGVGAAMTRVGVGGGGDDAGDKAGDAGIQAIAKRLRAESPSLSAEQAYAKALETPEGLAIFKQMRQGR